MTNKPTTAEGHDPRMAGEARRMCLYVATILGDLIDEVVVIGGLVPYLIVDRAVAADPHVGTQDLDLGLFLALLDDARYRDVRDCLRDRGFQPGRKKTGSGADEAGEALVLLSEDFASPDHVGPMRAAEFITGRHDAEVQADAFGYVQEFLSRVSQSDVELVFERLVMSGGYGRCPRFVPV